MKEHGLAVVNFYQRPPPQVRATTEDISQLGTSATIEYKSHKMFQLAWHDFSTPLRILFVALLHLGDRRCYEIGFGDVAEVHVSEVPDDHVVNERTDSGRIGEHVVEEVKVVDGSVVENGVHGSGEEDVEQDAGTNDDDEDDDFLVDEENEILEPDVDVHLFGISKDVPFDNIGITSLVPEDVLE
ncbi:hypothetical protein Tco_1282150 [Tanacetum coccineum]